jgi:hypothetical protein
VISSPIALPRLDRDASRHRLAFATRLTLLLTAALALCACAHEEPKPALPSVQTLVGTPKQHLLACAGPPAGDYTEAGLEYMTYRAKITVNEGYLQSLPTIPVVGSVGMGGKGNAIACEARIVLKDGTATALVFQSDPAQERQTTDMLCAPIVARCLSP